MSGLKFLCECGARYVVQANVIGRKVRCPKCGVVSVVREPAHAIPATPITARATSPVKPPPLPTSGVSSSSNAASASRQDASTAVSSDAREKPVRIWPATWVAIIVAAGTALLLLWAVVFKSGGAPTQQVENNQSTSVAAQTAESLEDEPTVNITPDEKLLNALNDNSSGKESEIIRPTVAESALIVDSATLYANSLLATATIYTKDSKGHDAGQGSGFFIPASQIVQYTPHPHFDVVPQYQKIPRRGYLVTNYHVMRAAASAKIRVQNFGLELDGNCSEVLMEREDLDLALLTVSFWPPAKKDAGSGDEVMDAWDWAQAESKIPWWLSGVPTLELVNGVNPAIGTKVYAIGTPQGLDATLSEGIVSSYRDGTARLPRLQFTAPVSPGSSGGPLLDSTGRVVGVVTALHRGGQNLNFAVPVTDLLDFLRGQCNSREIWRGASIDEDLRDAVRLVWNEYHQAEGISKEAIKSILLAIDQTGPINKVAPELKLDFLRGVLEQLMAIEPTLCGDIEYLLHYARGKTCVLIANTESSENIRQNPPGSATAPEQKQTGEDLLMRQAKNLQRSSDHLAGLQHLAHSIQLNDNFAPAYEWLCDAQAASGKHAEALRTADRLVRLVPRCFEVYHLRGAAFKSLRQFDSALEDYTSAADLSPLNPDCYFRLAEVYTELDEHNKAVESYKTAIGLGEDDWSTKLLLGFALKNAARYSEAIPKFQDVREQALASGNVSSLVTVCDEAISECRLKLQR